jgi:hypothetical protein
MVLSVPENFIWRVAAALIATGTVTFFGYLFRAKIALQWDRLKNYLFDSKVQVDLTRVDRYEQKPEEQLDMSVFESLKDNLDEVTFEGLSDDTLQISVPNIPTSLEIRIEHEPSLGAKKAKDERYEVQIKTQAPMTFGFRSDECLEEFERVAENVSDEVQEIFTKQPISTFLTGTLYEQAPIPGEEIKDDSLGMRAELRDSTLEMRFDDPRRLVRGIRKYFRPIQ